MLPLRWMPQLSIGSPLVDSQHQKLFDLYNEVSQRDPGDLEVPALVEALFDYAKTHFREEEAYMAEIGYPATAQEIHRMAHSRFLHQLEELEGKPLFSTLDFLREWLLRHIMSEDRKVGTFLRSRSPSA